MNDGQMHSTLREWRDHMTAPACLAVLGGVALILGIVVPFGTDETLGPISRFAYWTAIVVVTYGAGVLINELIGNLWRGRIPLWQLILTSCIATGIAISVIVTGINFIALGFVPNLTALPGYIGSIFAVAFIVAAIFHLLSGHKTQPDALPPRVLERLPFEKRGRLLALSVEDHYVRVQTSKGADVTLMRLSDAMYETGDVTGLQVHRSHWIALSAVQSARRDGDRAIITLTNETEIPVSRRYVPDVKAAGLLVR